MLALIKSLLCSTKKPFLSRDSCTHILFLVYPRFLRIWMRTFELEAVMNVVYTCLSAAVKRLFRPELIYAYESVKLLPIMQVQIVCNSNLNCPVSQDAPVLTTWLWLCQVQGGGDCFNILLLFCFFTFLQHDAQHTKLTKTFFSLLSSLDCRVASQ